MKKTIWFLLDNRMGSVGQARGIMQALDTNAFDIVEKKIEYNRFADLPNFLLGKSLFSVTAETKKEVSNPPFPDIVVSISRRTVPVARFIRKASRNKTKMVQLMHPGKSGLKEFSLVVVPEHDRNKAQSDNIFYITGCPHRITPEVLAEEAPKWTEAFANLPKPWTAVIIGGAIKNKPFTDENARLLGESIRRIKEQIGGSILITTSRRTGEKAEEIIKKEVEGIPAYTYWWGEKKDNPIKGFWALAENVIVTGDSVSMACESCGSGKPVWVFTGKNWLTPKHERFVQSLIEGGYAAHIDAPDLLDFKPKQGLNPSQEVAEKISKL